MVDEKRRAAGNIRIPTKGAWKTEGNNDDSSLYPCKACETKEGRTQILLSSIYFLFNYIILITIIWQNLGGREGRALAGPPRVAVSLAATLH